MQLTKEAFTYILAGVVFLATIALAMVLVFVSMPQPSHDILLVFMGSMTTICVNIAGYYWGSSSSSKEKDATIDGIIGNLTGGAAKPTP